MLVIHDETATRRLFIYTLKPINIKVVGAADASNGLELVKRLKGIPHLQNVPMVMFTARNNESDRRRAIDAGAVNLFYKFFSTHELREIALG